MGVAQLPSLSRSLVRSLRLPNLHICFFMLIAYFIHYVLALLSASSSRGGRRRSSSSSNGAYVTCDKAFAQAFCSAKPPRPASTSPAPTHLTANCCHVIYSCIYLFFLFIFLLLIFYYVFLFVSFLYVFFVIVFLFRIFLLLVFVINDTISPLFPFTVCRLPLSIFQMSLNKYIQYFIDICNLLACFSAANQRANLNRLLWRT